ncbi:MAG: cell division protein FtsZ [Oscillospiraceae bacterium]|jgi:cell division protein FtsZ|nr:cell division protein FtsZ [Oscillospiraceae bacterium]
MQNETGPDNVVVIKVIGVGGAGNNAVNRMVEDGIMGVEFVAVNTDKPALSNSKADQKIQIGEKLTAGQGAGSNPDVGKKAAEESRNAIAKALEDTDMVFIAAGMGGGTGTGASPIVADIAREQGILTVGVVTKPFGFEGSRRMRQAEDGIRELLGKVDTLFVIPNDRIKYVDDKISFKNSFTIADGVLAQAVNSISELATKFGFINLDFADITSVMKDAGGGGHIGIARASGKGKAEEAAKQAFSSMLMDTTIDGAKSLILSVVGSGDMGLEEVETAMQLMTEAADPDANIIFGTAFDDSAEDEIRITVIATRFGEAAAPISKPLAPTERAPSSGSYSSNSYGGASTAAATPRPTEPENPPDDDPFDTILKIFNSK